jgi:hypothetical protein
MFHGQTCGVVMVPSVHIGGGSVQGNTAVRGCYTSCVARLSEMATKNIENGTENQRRSKRVIKNRGVQKMRIQNASNDTIKNESVGATRLSGVCVLLFSVVVVT